MGVTHHLRLVGVSHYLRLVDASHYFHLVGVSHYLCLVGVSHYLRLVGVTHHLFDIVCQIVVGLFVGVVVCGLPLHQGNVQSYSIMSCCLQ